MKIDRLIGILSILLQQEKVTAPYLAERFEVSRRTINRDVEDICKAGIPLVTTRGPGGGISILEGYRMDRTLLTSRDMESILAGLKSLDSVSGTGQYRQLMDKLAVGRQEVINGDGDIVINLSSWYRESLAPKIELIQEAVREGCMMEFTYYSPSGRTLRKIEPYQLVFQWNAWYVRGYCTLRQDYRMFKLNRMTELTQTGDHFLKRETPPFDNDPQGPFPLCFQVRALCRPEVKWRLVEEFGIESIEEREDGMLLFSTGYSDRDSLISWILSMGDSIELLEPEEFRNDLEEISGNIFRMYGQT
ncbi:MAG: YafY family transcriptional regulator [Clostridium sp.]|nr:YafY family transcriptional regulator [Clostridium sp.]